MTLVEYCQVITWTWPRLLLTSAAGAASLAAGVGFFLWEGRAGVAIVVVVALISASITASLNVNENEDFIDVILAGPFSLDSWIFWPRVTAILAVWTFVALLPGVAIVGSASRRPVSSVAWTVAVSLVVFAAGLFLASPSFR